MLKVYLLNRFSCTMYLALQSISAGPSQMAMSMGPTWGPPGYCRPQMGPMLAPWTLLLGIIFQSTLLEARTNPRTQIWICTFQIVILNPFFRFADSIPFSDCTSKAISVLWYWSVAWVIRSAVKCAQVSSDWCPVSRNKICNLFEIAFNKTIEHVITNN